MEWACEGDARGLGIDAAASFSAAQESPVVHFCYVVARRDRISSSGPF